MEQDKFDSFNEDREHEVNVAPGQKPDPFEQEEFASEFADVADVADVSNESEDRGSLDDEAADPSRTIGWIALALAFVSLFVWPSVLGPAAVVIGLVAWMRGSRALGIWSIVLGLISFLVFLFLLPLYA